jgi:glutamate formiminotransferase
MPNQEHYSYFNFCNNEIFEYHSGASLGDDKFGKGHYQIKNDSLTLNYDLTEIRYESYFKAQKYFNTKDSIQVNLNIYDFNKKPLYNVIVYSYPNIQSTESNQEGVAFLKLKKGNHKDKIELHIYGSFWSKQIIYLDSEANYNIDVFMSKSVIEGFTHPKAIKHDIKKYEIVKFTDNYIKLKNEKGILRLDKRVE